MPINWATSDSNSLQQMHTQMGYVNINLAGGGATVGDNAAASKQLSYRVAHGAMMLAAFVLLMPGAALIARHKWLFGDKEVGPEASSKSLVMAIPPAKYSPGQQLLATIMSAKADAIPHAVRAIVHASRVSTCFVV
jgi:hypothetical protein